MLRNLCVLTTLTTILLISSCWGEPKPYEVRVTGRQEFTLFFDSRPTDMLAIARDVEREYCHQDYCTIRFVFNEKILASYNKTTGNLIDFNR